MPECAAERGHDSAHLRVARKPARQTVDWTVRRRLDFARFAEPHEGGEMRQLVHARVVVTRAGEQRAVQCNDGGTILVERAGRRQRGHASHLDVVSTAAEWRRGERASHCGDEERFHAGRVTSREPTTYGEP